MAQDTATVDAWKKALQNLVTSLDSFASATDALRRSERQCSARTSTSTPEQATGDDVYSRISEAYARLDGFEGKLGLARTKIQNIRNQSSHIVSIHRLPDECFSNIFVLGCQDPAPAVDFDGLAGEAFDDGNTSDEEVWHGAEVGSDYSDSEDEPDDYPHEDAPIDGEAMDVGSEDGVESQNELKATEKPFNVLVSHICHRWRKVALSTGQLWTCVELTEPPPQERLKTWLDRSGSHSLDITLNAEPFAENDGSLVFRLLTALEHLKSSVSKRDRPPRCVSLTIVTRHPFKIIALLFSELALVRSRIRLQKLSVCDRALSYRSSMHTHPWKALPLLEMLQGVSSLHLDGFYFPWDHPVYTNLTDLAIDDLGGMRVAHIEAIFRACPLLESFKLECTIINGFDIEATPSLITMKALHTFEVLDLDFEAVVFLFGTIRAPYLRRLSMKEVCCDASDDIGDAKLGNVLLRFFAIAGRSLRHFSIHEADMPMHARWLVGILRKAPCLMSFELRGVMKLRVILQALIYDNICPELQSLVIVPSGNCSWRGTSTLLLSLVINREHIHPIQYLAAPPTVLKGPFFTSLQERVPRIVTLRDST
ncbi:hypothetical protein BOTBODRAFT_26224 [Botryobasidium botryosum FD-172 SS1]|uniref:F-box domain-containing protein n=1 Tax=Botryobasidium botryosum (strain FD-172 SS1) TaxID=930990 RepID=A0A067NCK5_BOTB1|nr:hypothetical protein BOTBODRAFT_26224 [Botryobasidium botryosum FD-172 SS1]